MIDYDDELTKQLSELSLKEREMNDIQDKIKSIKAKIEHLLIQSGADFFDGSGYHLIWRKNSSSHSMDWDRLEKGYTDIYQYLMNEKVARLTPPKKERSLVFNHVKEGEPIIDRRTESD